MIHSASFLATGSDIVASIWVASSGLRWRISSMTFSIASVSAFEVDEVAATAAGATWRGVLLLTVILLAVELGTKLRAIGRGFGRGALGLAAQAFVASADKPTASVRLVAKAVDRNAAARTRRFTAFLRCESFN